MIEMVTNDAIIKAAKRLKGKIVRTPLLKSDDVNKELKSNIYIKIKMKIYIHFKGLFENKHSKK